MEERSILKAKTQVKLGLGMLFLLIYPYCFGIHVNVLDDHEYTYSEYCSTPNNRMVCSGKSQSKLMRTIGVPLFMETYISLLFFSCGSGAWTSREQKHMSISMSCLISLKNGFGIWKKISETILHWFTCLSWTCRKFKGYACVFRTRPFDDILLDMGYSPATSHSITMFRLLFFCCRRTWVHHCWFPGWSGEAVLPTETYEKSVIRQHCSGWWFGCHEFYFPIYWVPNHPNWLSYFSEGWPNHQPVFVNSFNPEYVSIPAWLCLKMGYTKHPFPWPVGCVWSPISKQIQNRKAKL